MESEASTSGFTHELRRRFIKSFLDVLILQLVEAEATWGYDMIRKTEKEFQVKLRHGALYPALNRLESIGFLKSRTQLQKGRARKVYDITKKGKLFLLAYYDFLKRQLLANWISRSREEEK